MKSFDVYQEYLAIKKHFSSTYNYQKYQGKVKINKSTFENKPYKFFFEKLARKKDIHDYLIANLSINPNIGFNDLISSEADKRHIEWKKRMQSLSYVFSCEINKLPDYIETLKAYSRTHPALLKAYLSDDVSLETFCILLHISRIKDFWDRIIIDPIWTNLSIKVDKYIPFLSFDEEKMKAIAYEKFHHPSFCSDDTKIA